MNATAKHISAADLCKRFVRPRLTGQGVRDLNGPAMDGRYNGRRHSNCAHHRNPHYPVYREDALRMVEDVEGGTREKKVSVYKCTSCGEERWVE